MGLFDYIASEEYGVEQAESNLKAAYDTLKNKKQARDQAKAKGYYKNSRSSYDSNVEAAENLVKQRKLELANAKERLREAKKRRQLQAKSDAAAKSASKSSTSSKTTSSASKTSSSSSASTSRSSASHSSGSSSSRSSKANFSDILNMGLTEALNAVDELKLQADIEEEVNSYTNALNRKYPINGDTTEASIMQCLLALTKESSRLAQEMSDNKGNELKYGIAKGCKKSVDDLFDKMSQKMIDFNVERYVKSLNNKYPIDKASASDLIKWLPFLFAEVMNQEKEISKNQNDEIMYLISIKSKAGAEEIVRKALRQLKKIDKSLYNQTEIQELVKMIDPGSESIFEQLKELFLAPWKMSIKMMKETFSKFGKF